ncbi:sulfatase-like hydrolase/transferase [Halobacteriales archaeon Cl-PHB]
MPVSFSGWVSEFRDNFEDDPKRAVLQSLYCTYLGAWYTVTSRVEPGTNIYDRDWDALIILDACRVDALEAVSDEYDFLPDGEVNSIRSVGCSSYEWMVKTFTEDYRAEIEDTAHVTANGFAEPVFEDNVYGPSVSVPFGWPKDDVVDAEAFADLVHAWRQGRDPQLGNVPPSYLTDVAIETARESDGDRLVAHYAQPHTPYMAGPAAEDREPTALEADPWPALRDGEVSEDQVYDLYLDNLRYALDSVAELLENLDAERVVITADHGEAIGEWGAHGHPDGLPLPTIKRVPWVETTATDTGQRTPSIERSDETAAVEDHLADLGYM